MTASPVGSPVNSSSVTGTSITVDVPADPGVGNLLVMILGFWGGWTPAGLTDWVQKAITSDTASMRLACYTRVVDGTEPSSYSVSGFAASGDPRQASVIELSGHDNYDAGATTRITDADTSWDIPSVDTTVDDDLVFRAVFSQCLANTVTWSWSGSTSAVTDFYSAIGGSYYGHLAARSQVQASAGATGALTLTRSADTDADNYAQITFGVKPGAASAAGMLLWDGADWADAAASQFWDGDSWAPTAEPAFP